MGMIGSHGRWDDNNGCSICDSLQYALNRSEIEHVVFEPLDSETVQYHIPNGVYTKRYSGKVRIYFNGNKEHRIAICKAVDSKSMLIIDPRYI